MGYWDSSDDQFRFYCFHNALNVQTNWNTDCADGAGARGSGLAISITFDVMVIAIDLLISDSYRRYDCVKKIILLPTVRLLYVIFFTRPFINL